MTPWLLYEATMEAVLPGANLAPGTELLIRVFVRTTRTVGCDPRETAWMRGRVTENGGLDIDIKPTTQEQDFDA